MTDNRVTHEDQKLFHKIECEIKENCSQYTEAGKWLEQFYDEGKFWQKKKEILNALNDICKDHKECDCEFCEEAEWLKWTIDNKRFTSKDEFTEIMDMCQKDQEELFKDEVPPIYRLLEAKSKLISEYISNCGMLSEKSAKCVCLINWLLTSPELRNDTSVEITKFQRYEVEDFEGIIYSRMGLLFSTQQNVEQWIEIIKTAQQRLGLTKQNRTTSTYLLKKQKDSNMIKIFISHSSEDIQLAEGIIDLLKNALRLSSKDIRCTSVDGYRLPGGAKTEEQLRNEVCSCETLIGLISPNATDSLYVLFELGARWGSNKHLL